MSTVNGVPRQNQLSIVAFVLAFVASIGGIICGHLALAQIKGSGEDGRGLALAGLIIGYVVTALWLVVFSFSGVFYILFFVALSHLGFGDHPG